MKFTVAVTGLHAGESPQPGCGVIRSLRRVHPDLTVIGLIYDVLESGVYVPGLADAIYEIPYPSAGTEPLLARLDYILDQHPIDILIPTLDVEILPLIKLERELARRGVRMLLPTQESFEARNKTALTELVRKADCHTPRTVAVSDVAGLRRAAGELGYPLIIKGAFYGGYKEENPEGLVKRFHAIEAQWGLPVLVQRLITGSEFNVIAVGDGEGGVSGFCALRKTIVSDKGKGFGGIVIRDDVLNETALRLVRTLRWRGPMELEFIQDGPSGVYHLIEINPRFPAWVDFPSTFGHNLPALVVERLQKGSCTPLPPYAVGKFFIRHCVDLTCDVEQMGMLSTLGELVRQPPAAGSAREDTP